MITTPQWAAILAGGDGVRLQALTTSVTGDRRPKQYCRLLGSQTLLAETRDRLARVVPPEQTVFVVSRAHERFYTEELAQTGPDRILSQPVNRGTLAAVAFTLARLRAAGVDGVVGFFPCDHYYRDTERFSHVVSMAYWQAQRRPGQVILVGAEATDPETDYGWIEPGVVLPNQQRAVGCRWTMRAVERFVEKPTASTAQTLLERGCVWNTLVVIGHIDALDALVASARPDMMQAFAQVAAAGSAETALAHIYRTLRPGDFSSDALAAAPERLTVMTVPDLGWTDLGRPERVADVLAERHHVLVEQHMVV